MNLNRNPAYLADAQRLIDELREEVLRRPRLVAISRENIQKPFAKMLASPELVDPEPFRIEVTHGNRCYTFQEMSLRTIGEPKSRGYLVSHDEESAGNIMSTKTYPPTLS